MQQEPFDPYRKWLGIQPKDQPPNFYRLLGIDLFENDADVISHAADQRMTHIRTFQNGPQAPASQRILNELSAAKLRLLDPVKRQEYDAELRRATEVPRAIPAAPPTRRSVEAATAETATHFDVEIVENAPGGSRRIPMGQAVSVDEGSADESLVDAAIVDDEVEVDGEAVGTYAAQETDSSLLDTQPNRIVETEVESVDEPEGSVDVDGVAVDTFSRAPARNGNSAGARPPAARKGVPARPGAATRAALPVRGKTTQNNLPMMLGIGGGGVVAIAVLVGLLIASRDHGNKPPDGPAQGVPPPPGVVPAAATAPQLDAIAELKLRRGDSLRQRLTVAGRVVDPAYRLQLANPPAGARIDENAAQLVWEPAAGIKPDLYPLHLQVVRRDNGQVVSSRDISVRVLEGRRPPQIAPIGDRTVVAGETLALTIAASVADLSDTAIAYHLDVAPAGASLDPAGNFRYQAPASAAGTELPVVVRLTSGDKSAGEALSTTQQFRIRVLPASGPTDGHGLHADFFADSQLTDRRGAQNERRIDGFWQNKSPLAGVPADRFAVRYSGWLRPPQPGRYTLIVCANGGFRLSLDGVALLDQWNAQGPTRGMSSQLLDARPRALKLEYQAQGAPGIVRLQWARPDGTQEIVPNAALYTDAAVAAAAPTLPIAAITPIAQNAGLSVKRYDNGEFSGEGIVVFPRQLEWLWGNRFLGGGGRPGIVPAGGIRPPTTSWTGGTLALRCEGQLLAPQPGEYRLEMEHDGRLRLWIDGKVQIDAWEPGGVRRDGATVDLQGKNDIKIEYLHEGSNAAAFAFRWRTPEAEESSLVPIGAMSHDVSADAPPPLAGKQEIPAAADIARQMEILKQEFATDYAATGDEAKRALAEKLRNLAFAATTPQRRWALLSESRALAFADGNLPKAAQVTDLMESMFKYDGQADRAAALRVLADRATTPEDARNVTQLYVNLLERDYRTGRFVAGSELLAPALAVATRAGDRELKISITSLGKKLKELAPEEARAEEARKALLTDPKDPAANFQRGRFLVLYQDNWTQGLPLLALGDKEAFRKAAAADLQLTQQPGDSAARKSVGDLWWGLQPFETDIARQRLRQRVMRWYGMARAGLAESAVAEVDGRLADIRRDVIGQIPREQPAADVPREKPAVAPAGESKPLDAAATRKLLQAVLDAGGRVRVEGSSDWLRRGDDLPHDDSLTALGLVPARDTVDEAALRAIGRLHSLQELTLESRGITDAGMFRLQDLTQLTRLEITAPKISDKSLTAMEKMSKLQTLKLHGEPLSGASLGALKDLSNLKVLELTGDRISDATFTAVSQIGSLELLSLIGGHFQPHSIDKLQELTKLKELTLRSRSVSNGVVARIGEVKSLTQLTLDGPFGGASLGELAKLDLERISLTAAAVRENDLQALSRMKYLNKVHLKVQPLGNGVLAYFSDLSNLKTIDIETASGVTDAGLQSLSKLTKLEWVNLRGAKLTWDGHVKFTRDHLNCTLLPKPDLLGGANKPDPWKRPSGGGGGGGGPRRPGPR